MQRITRSDVQVEMFEEALTSFKNEEGRLALSSATQAATMLEPFARTLMHGGSKKARDIITFLRGVAGVTDQAAQMYVITNHGNEPAKKVAKMFVAGLEKCSAHDVTEKMKKLIALATSKKNEAPVAEASASDEDGSEEPGSLLDNPAEVERQNDHSAHEEE